jgi:glycosyltransferase involved in cell wall biosynthesis
VTVQAGLLYPHLHLSFGCARTILVANEDTARRVPPWFRRKVRKLLETGISLEAADRTCSRENVRGLKLLWVGRLEKIKAGELALQACAHAAREVPDVRLTMVGSGPEEGRLKQLAADLGIASHVEWLGKVSHDRVMELLRTGDVFLFTSVRDTSGNVLLEAMAAGLPAITLRHHGAAEIGTDETAVRVSPSTPERTALEIGEAIVRLARAPETRRQMSASARQRVAEVFDWNAKAAQMDRIYRETLAAAGAAAPSAAPPAPA